METFKPPSEDWWILGIGEFLSSLPIELKERILTFLNYKSRRIAQIFRDMVLAKEDTFNLYAICTEINSGAPWMFRPSVRTYDERWWWSIDMSKSINGSFWDYPEDGEQFPEGTPQEYIRGTPVPLWWIRHNSKEFRSPFYILTEKYIFCSDRCGDGNQGACTKGPNPHICSCGWEEEIVWGHGPDPNFMDEFFASDEFNNKLGKTSKFYQKLHCDELSYRKNLCCKSITRNGCGFPTKTEWYGHQVQDPRKDCHKCVGRLKQAFGDRAHLYKSTCAYTRPRQLERYIDEFGWTDRPPVLKPVLTRKELG